MEHRREYERGEIVNCPKCDSDDLDCDSPEKAKCNQCGVEFELRTVAVWDE